MLLVETARLLGLTFFLRMGFTMKHNRDRRANRNCKLHKANSCGSLQSIPDLVSTFILTDLTDSSSFVRGFRLVEGDFKPLLSPLEKKDSSLTLFVCLFFLLFLRKNPHEAVLCDFFFFLVLHREAH